MGDLRKHSSTSNIIRLVLKNSSTGAPLTGLTEASAGLIVGTITDNEAATTRYRASSSEVETISTLGTFAAPSSSKCRFKEVDATNHPGLYEIQLADARFSVASAKRLIVSLSGATSLLATDYEIQLTQADVYDAVRAGLTAIPNAVAAMSGGLPTLSADQASNGTIQANVHRWLTGTPNALSSGRVEVLVGAVTDGVYTAAKFAAGAFDAVWSVATRLLTAGTNIVLAKGTGVTGFNDLSAADVNAEADAALADAGVTTTVMGRIDVATSTRLAASDYTAPLSAAGTRAAVGLAAANLDTQLAALATLVGNLAIPTADENAEALLKFDLSTIAGEAARSPINALRFSRNKWVIAGGVLTVYKEDDSTEAWTAPVTRTAGDPVSAIDPA